jgi:hypothetical protein
MTTVGCRPLTRGINITPTIKEVGRPSSRAMRHRRKFAITLPLPGRYGSSSSPLSRPAPELRPGITGTLFRTLPRTGQSVQMHRISNPYLSAANQWDGWNARPHQPESAPRGTTSARRPQTVRVAQPVPASQAAGRRPHQCAPECVRCALGLPTRASKRQRCDRTKTVMKCSGRTGSPNVAQREPQVPSEHGG